MGSNNAINLSQQGVAYYNGTNTFSGLDGISPGYVLTSNGTGVAPSFQPISALPGGGAFMVYASTDLLNVTGDGTVYTIVFDSVTYDTITGYNPTNGIFTAPVTGTYIFSGQIAVGPGSGSEQACGFNSNVPFTPSGGGLKLGGSSFPTSNKVPNFLSYNNTINHLCTATVQLTAGDFFSFIVIVSGGSKSALVAANSWFSGALISTSTNAFSTGSWTPTLSFGNLSTGITYGVQQGQYTKIGNLVNYAVILELTSKGSATGLARLGGIPFTNTGMSCAANIGYAGGMAFGAGYNNAGLQTLDPTSFLFFQNGPSAGVVNMTDANFTNNSNLQFTGIYFS